jgi:hypothetical protein
MSDSYRMEDEGERMVFNYEKLTVANIKQTLRAIGHLSFPPKKTQMVAMLTAWDKANYPRKAIDLDHPPKQNRGKQARSKPALTPAVDKIRQTLKRKEPSLDVASELPAKRSKAAERAGTDVGVDDTMLVAGDIRTSQVEDDEMADLSGAEVPPRSKATPKTREHVPPSGVQQTSDRAADTPPQGQAEANEDNQGDAQSIHVKPAGVQKRPVHGAVRKTGAAQRDMSKDQSSGDTNKEFASPSTSRKNIPVTRRSRELDNEDEGEINDPDERVSAQTSGYNEATATIAETPPELQAENEIAALLKQREKVEKERKLNEKRKPSAYVDPWVQMNHRVKHHTEVTKMDNDIPPGKERAPTNQVCHQRQEERMLEEAEQEAKEQNIELSIWKGETWPPEPVIEYVDYVQYD